MKKLVLVFLILLSYPLFAREHYFGLSGGVRSIPCSIDKTNPYVVKQFGVLFGLRFNDKLGIELDLSTGQSKTKNNVFFNTKVKVHGLSINLHHYIPVTSNTELVVGLGTASLTHVIKDYFDDRYERYEKSRLVPRALLGFQYCFTNTLSFRLLGSIDEVSKLRQSIYVLENEKLESTVIHNPKKSLSGQGSLLFRFR